MEHLKTRFAEQRARAAPNQVPEEEESMILEALGRMRLKTAAAEQRDNPFSDSGTSPRQSSTNCLFESGKFRGDVYIRTARGGSGRSALSNTGFDATTISRTLQAKTNFLRSGSPEETDSSSVSTPSSPRVLTDRESLSTPQSSFLDSPSSISTDIRLSHTLHPEVLECASLALEEVILEIEKEAGKPGVDDNVVLVGSTTADQRQRATSDDSRQMW